MPVKRVLAAAAADARLVPDHVRSGSLRVSALSVPGARRPIRRSPTRPRPRPDNIPASNRTSLRRPDCPITSSSDWTAWVNAMPGPNAGPRLIVTGKVVTSDRRLQVAFDRDMQIRRAIRCRFS